MLLKTIKILLVISFFSGNLFGQTANEVLKKVTAKMNSNEKFEYYLKYNLYKGSSSTTIFQSYNGFFQKRAADDYYLKIDDTEFLYKSNLNIKINHNEKAIALVKEDTQVDGVLGFEYLLKLCKVTSFKANQSGYEVILVPGPYSGLHYSKISLIIGLNHFIKKQTFFYNSQTDFSKNLNDSDLEFPRLEILYFNLKQSVVSKKPVLNDFVTFAGNRILTKSKYKSYQIVDLRKK